MRKTMIVTALFAGLTASSPAVFAEEGQTFSGNASWYGVPFHGKKTASGELFDMNKLSGAHKSLPMQSKVLVENPRTGKAAVVKVNDRGPFVKTRVMDLSRQGAVDLGYISHGTAFLDFTVLPKSTKARSQKPSDDKSDNQAQADKKSDKE
jgi:rare lipoprotein A